MCAALIWSVLTDVVRQLVDSLLTNGVGAEANVVNFSRGPSIEDSVVMILVFVFVKMQS